MDLPIFKKLGQGRIILASKSPRRKQILEQQLGLKNISVLPSNFAEDFDKNLYSPFEYVMATASQKALDVYKSEVDSDIPPSLVLAADTVVVAGDSILEKPRSLDHHVAMLKRLRDSPVPHKVFTAIACIVPYPEPISPGYSLETHLEETEVYFDKDISDELIMGYIKTGEGRDAAGGYKIQEKGALFISKIVGDYYNVVGLPVTATLKLISKTFEAAQNVKEESD